MFTIGDFAKHGRVSIRMLRHYDAIGLLHPARVDPASGYRFYEAAQLARLNRIIALKDLGFRLEQVGAVLDEQVGVDELRGMLRLRQAELAEAMATAAARLTQVEARLRSIESEGRMPMQDVVVKSTPAVRMAELTGIAAGYAPEQIGPVVGPLFTELCRLVGESGLPVTGPSVAWYEELPDSGGGILVHAGLPVGGAEPGPHAGFAVVDLPAVETVATIVHRGSMDHVLPTVQLLARWVDGSGHRFAGHAREVYLECDGPADTWVTELQVPLADPEPAPVGRLR